MFRNGKKFKNGKKVQKRKKIPETEKKCRNGKNDLKRRKFNDNKVITMTPNQNEFVVKKAIWYVFHLFIHIFEFIWRETLPTLYDLSQQTSSFLKKGKVSFIKGSPFFPQSRCNLVTKAMCGKNTDFYTLYLTTSLYYKVPLAYELQGRFLYSCLKKASRCVL